MNYFKETAIIWLVTFGREINRTVLNKILFFIDTSSLLNFNQLITDDTYIKKPYGPVPENIKHCRNYLLQNEYIQEKCHDKGLYIEYGYKAVAEALNPDKVWKVFSQNEQLIIHRVIANLTSYSAGYLSEITHKYEPWNNASWEEKLDLEKIKTDEGFKDWFRENNLILNSVESNSAK